MSCEQTHDHRTWLGNIPHPPRTIVALLCGAVLCAPPLGAIAAPVVDSLSASTTLIAPGGIVTLTVEAHDPDCPSTCTSGCGLYVRADLTQWTATGGVFVAEDAGTSGSPYVATADWQAPAIEGSYTVQVELADSGTFLCGGRQTTTASVDIEVTTVVGEPPVVESLTAVPRQVFPGDVSRLACIASDPDEDPLTYSWSTDHGTVTAGSGGTATFEADTPGVAAVVCTADDGLASASDTVLVSVTGAVPEKALDSVLVNPQRLAVDSMGDVYVADRRGGGITVLHLGSGRLVYRLPLPDVASVAVDWADRLLVGTRAGASVSTRAGDPLLSLGSGTVSDVAVDRVRHHYGVLYGKAGRVVVYDEGGSVLVAFGSTGDGPSAFRSARGLAVTPGGEWLVGDAGSGLIKVFDAAGNPVRSFGGKGGGVGEFVQIDDVAVDAAGLVYASDSFQDWVQVFEADGSLREVLGTYGDGIGRFHTAAGIAPVDDRGLLLAASLNGSSVQVFRTTDVLPPSPVPAVQISAGELSFGSQPLGLESSPETLVLSNPGSAPLGFFGTEVTHDFSVSNDCGRFLDPGASCSFSVTATPAAIGPKSGSLRIRTSSLEVPEVEVALDVSGFVPPGVWLSPPTVDFSDEELGVTSDPESVVLVNTGTEPLLLAGITVSGDYAQWNDCPSSLAGGTSCAIHVVFTPSVIADHILGELRIESNAVGSPHVAPIDGRGIELAENAGPPRVVSVASGGQELETCRSSREMISRLQVRFSEPMAHDFEAPEPGDANHPESYRVLAAGPDQSFDTVSCGEAFGDDVALPLVDVLYDSGTSTATLDLGTSALPASLYRLLVCARGPSVVDLSGQALDGDGDGVGGDDFALVFRADHPNLFANGHFDCDLEGWSTVSVFEEEIERSTEDVDGSDLSGSVQFISLTTEVLGVGQCLAVEANQEYRLGAWYRWTQDPVQPDARARLVASCQIFAEPDCVGVATHDAFIELQLQDRTGVWTSLEKSFATSARSRSALCSFALQSQYSPSLNLDRLVLRRESVIFSDGFESGDTQAWSVPGGGS